MEQSSPPNEEALDAACERLAAALERIKYAFDARTAEVAESTASEAAQSEEFEKLRAEVVVLKQENARLRELGETVAEGIDETIETLRQARS